MKILKNLLIGLGVLTVLFGGFAFVINGASSDFLEKHREFVTNYTKTFSRNWEVDSISELSTIGLLSQVNSPNGKHTLGIFRAMGVLVEVTEMELNKYSAYSSGPTVGIFKFKAKFENAKSLVTVTIHEVNGIAKVHGFHIEPIGNIIQVDEINA